MKIKFILNTIISFIILLFEAESQDESSAFISTVCVACLCEATTNCDRSILCPSKKCGPFQMERLIWIRSGRQVQPEELLDSVTSFTNCVNELKCAANTLIEYILSKERTKVLDYNKDGKITCLDDIAPIYYVGHIFRDYKHKPSISEELRRKLLECLTQLGEI